jgi:conjugal transfer/entry exclusion protein
MIKSMQFTTLILAIFIAVPVHANNVKIDAIPKGLTKALDSLDVIIIQSKKLKSRLDNIRNNPSTTTAKKRELLEKLKPQWQDNIDLFITVMRDKHATEEDIADAKERMTNYANKAFVCNDSGTNRCAD